MPKTSFHAEQRKSIVAEKREAMVKVLHTNLILNFHTNLRKCREVIREAHTVDELRHILYDQDEWFCMHPEYSNPEYDFYFHEEGCSVPYCKDAEMHTKERYTWESALKQEGHADWDSALDI